MADIGYGTKLEIGVIDELNAVTFSDYSKVIEMTLPSPEYDDIDITNFDSVDGTREFMAGLKDNGTVSITNIFEKGSAIDLILKANEGKALQLRYTFKNGDTETYAVTEKKYDRNVPLDDKMVAVADFRVSAEIV